MAIAFARLADSDLFYSFRRSPLVVLAAVVTAAIILSALLAPWIAPHNPFDLATLNLLDAFTPPAFEDKGFLFHSIGDKYLHAVATVARCMPVMIPAA